MIRITDETTLRQYWDELGMWEWEYYVQNIDISKDFLREFADKIDWLQWDDIFRYQERIEQRGFDEFRYIPQSQDVYIIMEHPELSNRFIEYMYGTKNITIKEKI